MYHVSRHRGVTPQKYYLKKKKKNEKEEEKKKGVMRVLSFVVVDSPHTPPLLPVSQIFTQPIATSLLQV